METLISALKGLKSTYLHVTSLRQSDVMSRDRPTFWHPQKAARSSNIGNMKSKSNKNTALFLDLERANVLLNGSPK